MTVTIYSKEPPHSRDIPCCLANYLQVTMSPENQPLNIVSGSFPMPFEIDGVKNIPRISH